jgi:hypothetical protein
MAGDLHRKASARGRAAAFASGAQVVFDARGVFPRRKFPVNTRRQRVVRRPYLGRPQESFTPSKPGCTFPFNFSIKFQLVD